MTQHQVLGAGEPVTGTQSVERALALLSLVGRGGDDGVDARGLVAASGLNKPTARRLLMALIRARLIEQDPATRRYRLGQEAYVLGTLAARRHGLLEQAAESLRRLSGATADTSFVSARHGDYVLCLHREEGSHPVRTHALQTGDQHPLGVGAGSLALLAALPEAEREAAILRLAGAYAALSRLLGRDRPRGRRPRARRRLRAQSRAASCRAPGASACRCACPDGRVAGALSIAAIDSRMHPARQHGARRAAHRRGPRRRGAARETLRADRPAKHRRTTWLIRRSSAGRIRSSASRRPRDTMALMAEVVGPALAHAGVGGRGRRRHLRRQLQQRLPDARTSRARSSPWAPPGLEHVPAVRMENACATGSAALYAAMDFIAAGRGRIALVVGAEKMTAIPTAEVGDVLLTACYREEEGDVEGGFAGIFGLIAGTYFQRYGDRSEELAMIAAKNHANGARNPYAHLQKDLGFAFCNTVSDKNPYVAGPLRRTDCSLVSDGAAALVLADAETAAGLRARHRLPRPQPCQRLPRRSPAATRSPSTARAAPGRGARRRPASPSPTSTWSRPTTASPWPR